MLSDLIRPTVERGDCEHMAALLRSAEDLPPLLASFYELGAARNGWLVHGSLPGEADGDRQRLEDAGLEVGTLEGRGQFAVLELDLTVSPDEWVKPWSSLLDERLSSGFDALWFARFPIGPTAHEVSQIVPFEAEWMRCFRGRRVVTLCPYIVGGLTQDARSEYAQRVGPVHDRIIDVPAAGSAPAT